MTDTSDHSEPSMSGGDVSTSPPSFEPSRGRSWLGVVTVIGAVGLLIVAAIATRGGGPAEDTVAPQGGDATEVSTEAASGTSFPWETDAPSLIPLEEIRSGGPPPDGIPPIDSPVFESTDEADGWLEPQEPVLSLVHAGEARAYPLQVMTWHEIVNDVVAGDPITVTFCPLCNSAIAWDRRVETTPEAEELLGVKEAIIDLGTSGRLYRSNLVAYDRQTKSLWVQFTGQAVSGPFMGTELQTIPVQIVSWESFREAHPDAPVLSRDTGFSRNYGSNPYAGYDDIGASPFLFDGPTDERLRAMERVVTVRSGGGATAYPIAEVARVAREGSSVVHDGSGDEAIVVFFEAGTASALDATSISGGRDVGATGVFHPVAGERTLSFEVGTDGRIVDEQTGSTWNLLGEAVDGELAGERLPSVVHDDTFWFVWAAFEPDTRIWRP